MICSEVFPPSLIRLTNLDANSNDVVANPYWALKFLCEMT